MFFCGEMVKCEARSSVHLSNETDDNINVMRVKSTRLQELH